VQQLRGDAAQPSASGTMTVKAEMVLKSQTAIVDLVSLHDHCPDGLHSNFRFC